MSQKIKTPHPPAPSPSSEVQVKNLNSISQIIQYHRKKSGLTRIQLAELAGVGKTVIFDIEHGKQTIQLDTLLKILSVLNIHIEFKSRLIEDLKLHGINHEKS